MNTVKLPTKDILIDQSALNHVYENKYRILLLLLFLLFPFIEFAKSQWFFYIIDLLPIKRYPKTQVDWREKVLYSDYIMNVVYYNKAKFRIVYQH